MADRNTHGYTLSPPRTARCFRRARFRLPRPSNSVRVQSEPPGTAGSEAFLVQLPTLVPFLRETYPVTFGARQPVGTAGPQIRRWLAPAPDSARSPPRQTPSQSCRDIVRTIMSGNAPLDRYMNGQRDALSEQAGAGLASFRGKGNCTACHVGPTLSAEQFHNTGVAWRESAERAGGERLRPRRAEDREIRGEASASERAGVGPRRHWKKSGQAELERFRTKDARQSRGGRKIAVRSRPRRCARSRAPRRTCTTAPSRP